MAAIPIAVQQMMPSALRDEPEFPGFPRPVREVHQIEITSRCNLRCRYCPHPHMERPKVDISREHFEAALRHVQYHVDKGTQTELALTGIGEPLMHPDLGWILGMAREVIGYGRPLTFSTNGVLLHKHPELIEVLKPTQPRVYVSMHRPEVAAPAAVLLQNAGLLAGINNSFVTSAFDWGGTVKWHVNAPVIVCEYLRSGWCVVLADGRVTTCCLDSEPAGVVGHVNDAPGTMTLAPFSLCKGCHMQVPEPGQRVL
jgi:hypothetical protein